MPCLHAVVYNVVILLVHCGRHLCRCHACMYAVVYLVKKMPHTLGFVDCLLRDSSGLPWLQDSKQPGLVHGRNSHEQFTKPTVWGILSLSALWQVCLCIEDAIYFNAMHACRGLQCGHSVCVLRTPIN